MKAGLAALVLCTFSAAPAAAIDPTEIKQPPPESDREILLAPTSPDDERPGWFTGSAFHLAKKAGFGYTRQLKYGDRTLSFRVSGPVLRKQKAVGLKFRIRF